MKIYKNLWVKYESYFVRTGPARSAKYEASKSNGIGIAKINGKWEIERCAYYNDSFKDSERFPCVGDIDLKEVLLNAILLAIDKREEETHHEYE